MIYWIGDLNYRVQTSHEMTFEVIKAHADNFQIQTLLKHDQLLNEMKKENVFWDFVEMPIDFKPTYKYDPGTNDWDSRCVYIIYIVNYEGYTAYIQSMFPSNAELS